MAWTYTLDMAIPAGSADPKTLDTIIQNHKKAWQERLNSDHYMPLTGTEVSDTAAGEHRKVTLRALGSDPTNVADKGFLYAKDVSAKVQAHWEDEDGNIKVITRGAGLLNVDTDDFVPTNNTYITAVDNAGTGTVDLIKANGSDEVETGAVTELPDTSRLNSDAAPLEDEQLSNKKYVDDSVTKYVSSWANCAVMGTYTLTHGVLDKDGNPTDEILTAVQFKDTGNGFEMGVNRVYQLHQVMYEDRRSSPCITNITSTQATIQAGANHVAITFNTSGNLVTAATGQYRLIAW